MAGKRLGRGGPVGPGKGSQGPRQPVWAKRGGAGPRKQADAGRKEGRAAAKRNFVGPDAPGGPQKVRAGEKSKPAEQEAAVRVPEDRVMGVNPVLELLRSGGRPIDALYIDKEKGGKHFEEMIGLARGSGVTLKIVPREVLDKLSEGLRHQGALVITAQKPYADSDELIEKSLKTGRLPLIVILDGVEDPQNLGSIIRTAESAGADGVVIPEHRAAHLTAAVSRASAGALEHMPVAKVTNIVDFIGSLKGRGFWVVGLEAGVKEDYNNFDMKVPLAVVLGSEGKGIRPLVKKNCDAVVSLPMMGKVSSLNVSVAAGIILYEALRQRGVSKDRP